MKKVEPGNAEWLGGGIEIGGRGGFLEAAGVARETDPIPHFPSESLAGKTDFAS